MHDTPPKYSIYGRKCTFEGQHWSPDLLACLPHSPQSSLKFGRRNIKSMSVYLASYIFQNSLKSNKKKHVETEGKMSSLGTVSNFTFLLRLVITPYCP